MIPKKSNAAFYIFFGLAMYFFIVLFTLHYGKAADEYAEVNGVIEEIVNTEENTEINPSYGVKVNTLDSGNANFIECFMQASEEMKTEPFNVFPISKRGLKALFPSTVIFILAAVYISVEIERNASTMPGKDSGTSSWNKDLKGYNKEFVEPHKKDEIDRNIILAKDLYLMLDNGKSQRNLNCLIIGGSGTGKSWRIIKPNILQMNTSIIVTDPSGELLQAEGIPLLNNGYVLKVFSTSDMAHSCCYNPFDYIYDETGAINENKIATLVNTFIKNSKESSQKASGDPFWDKSAQALLSACALYLAEFRPKNQRNFYYVFKLVQAGKVNENDSSSKTQLDKIFDDAKKMNPTARCFNYYNTFKLAGAKTAASILVTTAVDLNVFSQTNVRNMTTTDNVFPENNLNLQNLGDEKTALFIVIPQADTTYNFLVSMMYSQLFDVLYTKAEKVCPNRYNIAGTNGDIISSMYETEEEAKAELKLFKNAHTEVLTEENYEEFKSRGLIKIFSNINKNAEICTDIRKDRRINILKKNEKLVKEKILNTTYIIAKDNENEYILKAVASEKILDRIKANIQSAKVVRGKLKLPFHVRCLLDEFANIGEIPEFNEKLATMRKYEISCTIVLQNLAQIKAKYDKLWESIIGNCDTLVFLGSSEYETCEYISKLLGEATIVVRNHSRSESAKGGNASLSFQSKARKLLDPAEVGKLNNKYCIIRVRGLDPFYMHKYDCQKHPNFKQCGDFNPKNRISGEYLETHFKCSDKIPEEEKAKTIEEYAVIAEKMKAKKAVEENKVPGTGNRKEKADKLVGESKSVNTKEDFAKVVEAKEPTKEEVEKKVKPETNKPKTPKAPNPASAPEETEEWGFS